MNRVSVPDHLAVNLRAATYRSLHLWGALNGDVANDVSAHLEDYRVGIVRVCGLWFENSVKIELLSESLTELVEERDDIASIVVLPLDDK